MILYVTFTNCHISVTVTQSHNTKENSRRFWKDNIIQYVIYILTLRQIHSHLE